MHGTHTHKSHVFKSSKFRVSNITFLKRDLGLFLDLIQKMVYVKSRTMGVGASQKHKILKSQVKAKTIKTEHFSTRN